MMAKIHDQLCRCDQCKPAWVKPSAYIDWGEMDARDLSDREAIGAGVPLFVAIVIGFAIIAVAINIITQ